MTQPMTQPTTHPTSTQDSPLDTTAPPGSAGRLRSRLTRVRRAPLTHRLARWLAVGASGVALLRAMVELLAAWRAL